MKTEQVPIIDYCKHCDMETFQDLEIISVYLKSDLEVWTMRCDVCAKTNIVTIEKEHEVEVSVMAKIEPPQGNSGLLSAHIPPPKSNSNV